MPAEPQLTAVERDKLEIDPNFDFRALAETPFDAIPPNVMAMFKWCGVYSQLQKGFFMIRLVTPGGLMTTRQFGRALSLAEQYAQGELCVTTRQTLQFHWVRLPDIHKVLEGMADVGMTTRNGCGDVARNTVSCSLQGVCPHEVGPHGRELIVQIATDPEIQGQQRNLPRKHKISVAGCDRACAQTLMNCQGWVPVARQHAAGTPEFGWRFHAGGGLGARPYLAKVIFDWVPHALALAVARATVEVFNRHGDRRNRALARLKIVVDKLGAAEFGKVVLEVMRERGCAGLDRITPAASPIPAIAPPFLTGQPVIDQVQPGLQTVRVRVPRSEIKAGAGHALCLLADTYGRGELAFTNRQNIEIRHVPAARTPELLNALEAAGFSTEGHELLPDIVACVGSTQCKMAVADTPKACFAILDSLGADEAFWREVGPLRINMNGCPNNCAHAWIADIGLRGKRRRGDVGENVEGYTILLGGKLSEDGHIGEPLCDADSAAITPLLRRLLEQYIASRRAPDELFIHYVERVGVDAIRRDLAITGPGDQP